MELRLPTELELELRQLRRHYCSSLGASMWGLGLRGNGGYGQVCSRCILQVELKEPADKFNSRNMGK